MIPEARIRGLAVRFGTPFYVYDFETVALQVERLRRALPARFEIAYAIKANPSLGVLTFLAKRGLGADVASRGELMAAKAAGFPPARILATGPAKTEKDLLSFVRSRVGQIHVEGPDELEMLEGIAKRLGRIVPVGLRLNPPWGIAETRTIIGGPGAKKFGFDLASARRILAGRKRFPHLAFGGFQIFNASNVLLADLIVENVAHVLKLALSLARRFDVPLKVVDFGGGFGVPYSTGERPLDLLKLSRGLTRVAADLAGHPLLRGTRLVFEPGRFLVAESGCYVVSVLQTKRSRGVRYALVDGGVHHLLRPALLGTVHRVSLVPRTRTRRTGIALPFVIAGPLCTSLDVLHPAARLVPPERGDLLVFENAGAYGYTESMLLFLSHEWPAEVGILRGRAVLLRRSPRVAELLGQQEAPF